MYYRRQGYPSPHWIPLKISDLELNWGPRVPVLLVAQDRLNSATWWGYLGFVPERNAMFTTTVYFGATIPDAGEVNAPMFTEFLKSTVHKLLDSFTLTEGYGCWNGEYEKVRILTIISKDMLDEVLIIAEEYKKQFRQESVLVNVVENHAFALV